jgi:hydrogenase-4 membrane subunit HyfE
MSKEKRNFSKLLVTLIVLLNIAFSSSVLFVFIQTGAEPSALVVAWYAFTTGELWLLAKIKREKIKKGVE